MDLLGDALAPLRGTLPKDSFDRLSQALSLIFGIEVYTVLKDIWGLSAPQSSDVAKWAACALVRTAVAEARMQAATGVET